MEKGKTCGCGVGGENGDKKWLWWRSGAKFHKFRKLRRGKCISTHTNYCCGLIVVIFFKLSGNNYQTITKTFCHALFKLCTLFLLTQQT